MASTSGEADDDEDDEGKGRMDDWDRKGGRARKGSKYPVFLNKSPPLVELQQKYKIVIAIDVITGAYKTMR